jgi:hypothetical protein
MRHPKDRSGLTRGQLLRGAGTAALGVAGGSLLAACENTTVPIGACEPGTSPSGGGTNAGGLAAKLVEAKPVGPGGLPLPRNDNSVTWTLTDSTVVHVTAAAYNWILLRGARSGTTTLRAASGGVEGTATVTVR